MLAAPLLPSPGFSEDPSQHRPVKDLEAFDRLLSPRIEFIEGSSSGGFAIPEGKYKPINESPKPVKVTGGEKTKEPKKATQSAPTKPSEPAKSAPSGKALYTGAIVTTWPNSANIGSGLNNTGNTCFLNSALQCLLHTPPLLHILIKHGESESCRAGKNAFCMSCSLRQVVFEVHGKRNRSFTPWPITAKLQVIAKHMRRGRQEDSHEFLRYAIDALQKSCLMGYPPKLDPKVAETTWVHQVFGGRLRSRVTCMVCSHNSDTFDRILDLSVDIYGCSSLKEALRKFIAVDHLKGADKYKCEKCKKAVVAEKQFTLHEAPLVLTVHLKRFSPMGRKISHPVHYDERLQLQPFMSEGQHGPTYSLYAVISHAGGGPNSGHYYAHVKSASGAWYEMNDESVTRHGGAPTGMRNAYILFYIRDQSQPSTPTGAKTPTRPAGTPKPGLIANMKKRKSPDSTEDDGQSSQPPSKAPFIGPQPPSSPTASKKTTPAVIKAPGTADPQAKALKKKIAAQSQKPEALNVLTQYKDSDGSEDDLGEKVDSTQDASRPDEPSSSAAPQSDAPASSSKAGTPSTIPATSFYGSSPASGSASGKKRKLGDDDGADDKSVGDWARTPISPGMTFASKKQSNSKGGRPSANGTPFSRIKGGNNLHQRRDLPTQYGGKKKKRMIM